MPTTTYSLAGDGNEQTNEDYYLATDDVVIVLDGATIRTETGCVHGLRWFVRKLGSALLDRALTLEAPLQDVLADSIAHVRALHVDTCDLDHPGTPSAAVGIARRNQDRLEWLVLGDITVLVETNDRLIAEVDNRVSQTAIAERRECDRHLIGTDAKMAAILAMKDVELASRNTEDGYWIASVLPEAAKYARSGSADLSTVHRVGVCSDGAMRSLDMTSINTQKAVMSVLTQCGPKMLVEQVRSSEYRDPRGKRWPRNKATDDATAVVMEFDRSQEPDATTDRDTSHPRLHPDVTRRLLGASPTRYGQTL